MSLHRNSVAMIGACVFFAAAAFSQQQTVTTTGGTASYVPKFSGTAALVTSEIYDTGTSVGIGDMPNSSARLDVNGAMIMRGNMQVTRTGNASATQAFPSYGFEFYSNVYNSSTKAGDNPYFTLQSEPTGNNTASPSATFNLLFANNGAASAETGFYINSNGTLHFALAQTFPIPAGPQGPAGPAGPQGATGPQGPAGTLTLPYSGSVDAGGNTAFQLQNLGASGGDGMIVIAADANSGQFDEGGYGIVVAGGSSTQTTGVESLGGIGIEATGGNALNNLSTGGYGGYFQGGSVESPGSTGGFGIYVQGGYGMNGVSGGTGVYATGNDGGSAAIFNGAVIVNGNLSKSGGSFKIDHPLDPANKYLYHSFVESPDMKNVYDGTVVTDGSGTALVTMPDYFEVLNRDYRYQLTVIGQFAQAIVGSEISNGSFVIKTDKPGVKVSWQVTGIRQDAWANAHRIPLEEEKTDAEKGHYLHPELYGHGGEASIPELKSPRPETRLRK